MCGPSLSEPSSLARSLARRGGSFPGTFWMGFREKGVVYRTKGETGHTGRLIKNGSKLGGVPTCLCKSLLCNFHIRTMRRISWGNIANPPKQAAALSCIRNNSLMLVEISANLVMDGESEWQIRLAGGHSQMMSAVRGREGGGRFLTIGGGGCVISILRILTRGGGGPKSRKFS